MHRFTEKIKSKRQIFSLPQSASLTAPSSEGAMAGAYTLVLYETQDNDFVPHLCLPLTSNVINLRD